MKYSEYINYIIDHPASFTFVINIVESGAKIYQIFTNSDTGMVRLVANLMEVGPVLVDTSTGLSVASRKDVKLDVLEKLAMQ